MGAPVNFRDCGGLRTVSGQRLKSDRLFRSGHLHGCGQSWLRRMKALDFALVADLRYSGERQSRPSPWPMEPSDRLMAHGDARMGAAPHEFLLAASGDGSHIDRRYREFYAKLPFSRLYRPLFARILSALPMVDGRVLVHCTAGKDRTGILVALILHALGIGRTAIVEDYLLSNGAPGLDQLGQPLIEQLVPALGRQKAQETVSRYLAVRADYLDHMFAQIEARCGTVDAYLDQAGLTAPGRASLQQAWLA
jgi:protein-tyrosine phosphatase